MKIEDPARKLTAFGDLETDAIFRLNGALCWKVYYHPGSELTTGDRSTYRLGGQGVCLPAAVILETGKIISLNDDVMVKPVSGKFVVTS